MRLEGDIIEASVDELGQIAGRAGQLESLYHKKGNVMFRDRVFNIVSALTDENRDLFCNTSTYTNLHQDENYVPEWTDFGVIAVFECLTKQKGRH